MWAWEWEKMGWNENAVYNSSEHLNAYNVDTTYVGAGESPIREV